MLKKLKNVMVVTPAAIPRSIKHEITLKDGRKLTPWMITMPGRGHGPGVSPSIPLELYGVA
jgi:hypothetical protein